MAGGNMVSIDIGSSNIHIVSGSVKKGMVVADDCVSVATPENSVDDGRITEPYALTEAVRSALNSKKMSSKDVIITIQSTQVILREINVPKTDEKSIKNMIKYEMEQYLPGNTQGYAVEAAVINEFDNAGVESYRMRAAAMPVEMVRGYYDMIKMLKRKPLALDIHSNAVSKLFAGDPADSAYGDRPTVYIDLGSSVINVHVFSKGRLELTRAVLHNPNDVINAFARVLGCTVHELTDEKMAGIDLMTLPGLSADSIEHGLLNKIFTNWFSDIQRVIQYFQSRNIGADLNTAYIFGGYSNLTGMAEYMKNTLSFYEVRKLDKLLGNKYMDTSAIGGTETYINALGAMIRATEVKSK